MKFREVMKFEKQNMPDFQWKFEKFLLVYLAVWLGGAIVTLIVSLVIGGVSGEDGGLWYIPMIVWGCALAVCTVMLVVKTISVRSKLVSYHTDKLSQEFFNTDYEQAKRKMIEEERMTEEGFIVFSADGSESEIIPFGQSEIVFDPRFWGGKLFLALILVEKDKREWYLDPLDNIGYNFLMNNTHLIRNKPLFRLFVEDKEKFVKMLLKYNDPAKIEGRSK